MEYEVDSPLHEAILGHLRTSGAPIRESFLFERVAPDAGPDLAPEHFLHALTWLETEGRVHLVPGGADGLPDPPPFQPRFWRLIA